MVQKQSDDALQAPFRVPGSLHGAGLENPSNDCFLNSVLQAVVHTPVLANQIINAGRDPSICRGRYPCVHCSLRAHILLACQSTSSYQAKGIERLLAEIFPAHLRGRQEDAHEMLLKLLNALDLPVPKPNGPLPPQNPVQDIFMGRLQRTTKCQHCQKEYSIEEPLVDVSLAIPPFSERPYTIGDLLDFYFADEAIDTYHCEDCKTKVEAVRRTKIKAMPRVLLIHLKRFDEEKNKVKIPVKTNRALDLSKFAEHIPSPENLKGNWFVLNGVIQHQGLTINRGHYVCAMRGFDRQTWYLFNDAKVSLSNTQEVLRMQAYLALYTRWDVFDEEKRATGLARDPAPQQANGDNQTNRPTTDHNGDEKTATDPSLPNHTPQGHSDNGETSSTWRCKTI